MNIDFFILHSLPFLSTGDTVARAIDILDETKLTGLPVVDGEEYQALVTEDALMEVADQSMTLEQAGLLHFKPAVLSSTHPLDAVAVMHQNLLPMLPVVDASRKYLGSVPPENLIGYVAENSGISNPGGIIVLEIPPRNYSLFDIARLCENEDVIILSLLSRTNERGMLELTLKLNRTVLDAVISSFERHKYHVVESYGRDADTDDLRDNYRQLMNYLNM